MSCASNHHQRRLLLQAPPRRGTCRWLDPIQARRTQEDHLHLGDLSRLLAAANRRYLDFISELEDPSLCAKLLEKVSVPASDGTSSYKGFNFFSTPDYLLLLALVRGEHCITGFRHADLKRDLPALHPQQLSRNIDLTELGRWVIVAGLKFKHLFMLPQLAASNA